MPLEEGGPTGPPFFFVRQCTGHRPFGKCGRPGRAHSDRKTVFLHAPGCICDLIRSVFVHGETDHAHLYQSGLTAGPQRRLDHGAPSPVPRRACEWSVGGGGLRQRRHVARSGLQGATPGYRFCASLGAGSNIGEARCAEGLSRSPARRPAHETGAAWSFGVNDQVRVVLPRTGSTPSTRCQPVRFVPVPSSAVS